MGKGSRAGNAAFTLVELLIVVAIMGMLVAVTMPSLMGLNTSGSMNGAVSGISSVLEQARSYAMANSTYVWVGFNQDAATQRVTVGAVAGTTGAKDDLASLTCAPLMKMRVYDHFTLRDISSLPGMAANGDNITASQIGTFHQTSGTNLVIFTDIVQYSPQGVASITTNSTSHWIQIGLQPIRGGNSANPNTAVFQIATLTGQVQVFRP